MNKKLFIFLVFYACAAGFVSVDAAASQQYIFDPVQSRVDGAIRYSLVGRYKARFQNFEGELLFDDKNAANSKVWMEVDVASLESPFALLDRIVRSSRLLDAARYPKATFKSTQFEQKGGMYRVTGDFYCHGVTQNLTFDFQMQGPVKENGIDIMRANGSWVINRKDFDIVWSKIFDRGGILVGNSVIIDWEITAHKKP